MEKEAIVVQNGELFGKGRAALRNEQLLQLIREWEKKRDDLLDEIAHSKGQVDLLEELVKESYEKMLDVNKEEQAKEQALIDERFEVVKKRAEEEAEVLRNEEALALHKKKQEDVKAGKKKGKVHPSERAGDITKRQARVRDKKSKE